MKHIPRKLILFVGSLFFALALFGFLNISNTALAACGGDDAAEWRNGGQLNCGDEDYYYDPLNSQQNGDLPNGYLVFERNPQNGQRLIMYNDGRTFLVDGNQCQGRASGSCAGDEITLSDASNVLLELNIDGQDYCSVIRPNNCNPVAQVDDLDLDMSTDFYGGLIPGILLSDQPGSLRAFLLSAAAQEIALDSCEDTIDNPLSFIVCPISNFITDALTTVINWFQDLLENPDLTGNSGLSDAMGSIIVIVNSFYILIFLIIIFANFIAIPGLDNYTIKKTLPKLIAAIILTQFSLLICQVILDLGNILAVTLPGQILDAFGLGTDPAAAFVNIINPVGGATTNGGINNFGDAAETIGQYLIFQLIILVGLLVSLVAFLYIIARYLALIVLVLTLPFAFAAWVLPNTEKFFKMWWTYFIKISIMLLLINLLFTFAAIFKKLLDDGDLLNSDVGNFLTSLIGVFVPLIALVLIPKTLKASTAIMSAAGKAVANTKAGGKVKEATKKSGEEGKLADLKGKGFGAASNALGGTDTKLGRSLKRKEARLSDSVSAAKRKDLELMKPEELKKRVAAGTNPTTGELNDEAKAAQGVLRTKHREKLVEAKAAFDAGVVYSPDEVQKLNDLADASGGRKYDEALLDWNAEKQARLNPSGGPTTPTPTPSSPTPTGRTLPDGTRILPRETPTGPPRAVPGGPGAPPAPGSGTGPAGPGRRGSGTPGGPGSPGISDIRLKQNICYLQTLPNGVRIYTFNYIWSPAKYVGVIAQEILTTHPDAVSMHTDGYYRVDYSQLGFEMCTHDQYQKTYNTIKVKQKYSSIKR